MNILGRCLVFVEMTGSWELIWGQPALPPSLAEAVWHFPAAKRTRFGCKIGLVTVTPY